MSMKTKKAFGICFAFALVMLALTVTVFADTVYTSYLDLPANTFYSGNSRQYNERHHAISLCPQSLPTGIVNLTIKLKHWGILYDPTDASTMATMTQTGNITYTYDMGSHDVGSYYYYFQTDSGNSIYASPVIMSSFD